MTRMFQVAEALAETHLKRGGLGKVIYTLKRNVIFNVRLMEAKQTHLEHGDEKHRTP